MKRSLRRPRYCLSPPGIAGEIPKCPGFHKAMTRPGDIRWLHTDREVQMGHFTRRDFLRTSLAGTALASGVTAWGQKRAASDWVTLGNSGVKVTRLAFGTGTYNGQVQRDLGQDGFTRLVRYAYDHGIRFFETAESYTGMAQMLGTALKGLPRDSYRLMTKYELYGSS